jgi:pSer/pThr/pTyr-binding forkhead associated (FHA) protein
MHNLCHETLGGEERAGQPTAELSLMAFPCVVGRETDCDLRLPHAFVSRHHCRFLLREGTVWIEDLLSRNGTFLNGERVREARHVRDGDQLDVAYLAFRVRLVKPPVREVEEAMRQAPADGVQVVLVTR